MKNWLVLLLCLPLTAQAFRLEPAPPHTEKVEFKTLFTDMPATTKHFFRSSFGPGTLPGWALLISSSALTYHYDADLYEGAQNTGRRWGLATEDKTRTVWRVGQYDILRLPSDTNSALYFLGDGWVHLGAAAVFTATGYFGDETRAWNTGLQLFHGMTLSTILSQIIKRSTGREAPTDRTEPRGAWRPFPSPKAYDANTAKYDAVPSGHVMTATLVFTVIRGNYPEHNWWLFPTEIVYLSALGFSMMNNGVHWASDYPLGFAIGYMMGKSSLRMGRQKDFAEEQKEARKWNFSPGFSYEGVPTVNLVKAF